MRHVTSFLQHSGLLIVRICFGLLLVSHAWHRWDQVGMDKEVAHLAAHHVTQPSLWAWGALVLEAVGGVMLVFGILVPLVALAVLAQNVLTIVWLKWPHGLLTTSVGFEHNLVQALLAFVLMVYGSGRAGLDAVFFRRRRPDRETVPVREVP